MEDDEALLARAESALTQIKVAQGLSDEHASVLAALRIRLKGKADATLDELLESAGDLGGGSLDDVLSQPEKPKPDLLG